MPMVTEKMSNISSECICGSNMISKKDTLVRVVRGREIRLHGIRFNQCISCGTISYNIKDNVAGKIAEAYKNNVTDIIF